LSTTAQTYRNLFSFLKITGFRKDKIYNTIQNIQKRNIVGWDIITDFNTIKGSSKVINIAVNRNKFNAKTKEITIIW